MENLIVECNPNQQQQLHSISSVFMFKLCTQNRVALRKQTFEHNNRKIELQNRNKAATDGMLNSFCIRIL